MNEHEKINYVEFPAKDIPATKAFFAQAFGWTFQDFGPDYTAFSDQCIDGGFFRSEISSSTSHVASLLFLYSIALESTQAQIAKNNGIIIRQIFSFPGGRRFHFTEPSGNEFGVWSDRDG